MLHKLHRISACIIGAYVAIHLFNHLLAIQSIDAHLAFMKAFRHIYRQPLVEILLLACVAFQVTSGIYFIQNRWGQRHGFFDRVQSISGGYLAYFLLVHVASVLYARYSLKLDTNFYFAAAGMHVPPFQFYFLPYYFLAVVAIFGHIACAVHWLARNHFNEVMRNRFGYAVLAIGGIVATLIVTAFAGGFHPVEIPAAYKATYQAYLRDGVRSAATQTGTIDLPR